MHDDETRRKLIARLKRVEGQTAAVRRMVEDDADCVDVLLQIAAARGALGRAGEILLGQHIRTCVSDAFRSGDADAREERVRELMEVFGRYGGIAGGGGA